jgi:hypothetical protein
MARTEREKQDELLGMIRRDFTPKAPTLELQQTQDKTDSLDLEHWGRAEMKDMDFYDVGGQEVHPVCFNINCHICNERERLQRTPKQQADIERDERRIDDLQRH